MKHLASTRSAVSRFAYISMFVALTLSLLALVGCSDDSDDSDDKSDIYVVHVTPDLGSITVYIDNTVIADGLEYADLSKKAEVDAEERVRVRILVDGNPAPVYDQPRTFRDDRDYIMIVSAASPNASSPVRVTFEPTNNRALIDNNFAIRFGNYSRTHPSVDSYVAFPGTAISALTPVNERITKGSLSSFTEIEQGEYEVSFTDYRSVSRLLSFTGINFRSGREYTVFLVEDEDRNDNFGAIVVDFEARD